MALLSSCRLVFLVSGIMWLTPFALVFLLIGLSSPVTSFTFPQYKLPALTEEIQNVLLKRFQITKNHHKLHEKIWEIDWSYSCLLYTLYSLTSFECPANKITGNGNDANLLNSILINFVAYLEKRTLICGGFLLFGTSEYY